MKSALWKYAVLMLLALAGMAASGRAELSFQTINMLALGQGNSSLPASGPLTAGAFPYGTPSTFEGVPFYITSDANQVWAAATAAGEWSQAPVSITFQMPVNNIYGFYTLANTWWGTNGLTAVKYTFTFDDNTSYSVSLTNGVDLRDFNVYAGNTWATTINGTTTINVYADPETTYHLDRQWIDLAAAGFGGKNLVSFTIEDTGGWNNSRIFLAAATAQVGEAGQVVPEPSPLLLLSVAGGFALLLRRRLSSVSAGR